MRVPTAACLIGLALLLAGGAGLAQQRRAQSARPPAPAENSSPLSATPLCRTAEEICFLGVVTGPTQVAIVLTNAPQAVEIRSRAIEVLSDDTPARPLDLAGHQGSAVLLTGRYNAQTGLTKASLIEVASPLVSTLVKGFMAAGPTQAAPSAKNCFMHAGQTYCE